AVTLTAIIVVRHLGSNPAAASPPNSINIGGGKDGHLTPDVLDRQWVTYSNRSTCADRSGGDGVSAVRLSSAQIAWFFSDSFLCPAGPQVGFSQRSGFVHNLVVVQTTRGNRTRLVTVTGGNACPGPGRPGQAVAVVSGANAGGTAGQRYWAGDGLR